MDREAEIDRLIDEGKIRRLLAWYPRGLDRQDPDLLKAMYHPGAIDDHGVFNGTGIEYADWMDGRNVAGEHWMHNYTSQIIEIEGDAANAETYCIAMKRVPGTDDQGRLREYLVRVRYLDRLEKRDGVWGIVHRRVVYAPNGVFLIENTAITPESLVEAPVGSDPVNEWSALNGERASADRAAFQ